MSEIDKRPNCQCFEEDFKIIGEAKASKSGREIAELMLISMKENGLCREAMPYVFDLAIVAMAAQTAIHGTAIEPGSEEAERETLRVLEGIEARAKERTVRFYAAYRRTTA